MTIQRVLNVTRHLLSIPHPTLVHWADRQLHTSSSAASFAFASASSGHGNLYKAIQECVSQVEEHIRLQDIDFCQLLVSTKHVSTLAHAPHCLLEHLHHKVDQSSCPPASPVVIGGALQSVCPSGPSASRSTPGVSLLVASLPGVELMPFHVDDASLPPFTAEQWSRLLQARPTSSSSSKGGSITGHNNSNGSSSRRSDKSCAAFVLSAPHFCDVERFLQRLSSALPNMPVVGGVTERDAWVDTENHYGALFCGADVYCNGAVGVVMQGPLVVRQVLLQSARPKGKMMTVTESYGNVILGLDNRPVHDSFVELLHSLPKADQRKELRLGIYDSSDTAATAAAAAAGGDVANNLYVARSMSLTNDKYGRPVLAVAAPEVPVGAGVQVLVWDYEANHQQQQQAITALADQLGTASGTALPPQQMAVLSYCCVALPFSESKLMAELLPGVPVGGGRMQGEFAGTTSTWDDIMKAEDCQQRPVAAKLHSYAASFALLHQKDLLGR